MKKILAIFPANQPNTAVKAAPSGRWTLRDKAPRSAPYLQRYALGGHMRALAIAAFLLLSVLAQPSFAQQKASARTLVERGLNAYLKDGATAAIQAWLKGSGLEGNTQAMTQANSLRQFEDFYGKPESFNIVRENVITPRSQMIVFAVNYAKGILFGRFQAYETKSGEWVATEFKFHTEAAAVLPPEIVFDLKTK